MKPLTTVDELQRLHEQLIKQSADEIVISVCSTGCRALGALEVCDALEREIAARGLQDKARVIRTGCHGLCSGAVAMVIQPAGIFYQGVTAEDAAEIVETTVEKGEVVRRLCHKIGKRIVRRQKDIPFYKHQTRLVLRNCGVVDPQSLEDAIAHGAYVTAAKALSESTGEGVIDEVLASGLRGRGGAGFPTGRKWQFARQSPGDQKYVVCNADEGDPGAFMDRAVLEGDPHLVIEGMILGAFAIGASHGFIYLRAEYPVAIEHTALAIEQAREAGLLGKNILGTGFDFDIEIRQGAGAFVCGEETALIASIEGKRGMPRPRPPFPAVSGVYGKPTNINNVETWANVPRVIELGGAKYAKIGTKKSPGTKIFALAGKVNNTGLVEVPMGTSLRTLVFEIGGGIPRERKFKAAQIGGPSGGCVPPQHLDVGLDYDSVAKIGAIMGSGGLIVMDEATCMVDIARFFTDFVQNESCGKCVPCRVGTKRMLEILTRITRGDGELADIDTLIELGEIIKETALCGLGQTAPNPVLSTIRYFRNEYEAHIIEKRCPSHACEALVATTCSSACPAHVNVPEYVALIAEGRFAESLEVIRRRNPFPSVCGRACDHPCETFCRRGDVDSPVAIRQLKRFVSDRVKDVGSPPQWRGPRHGRVAVVGAGPGGLTAGYFLALMGRDVTVFETEEMAGGVLATRIPDYRLPPESVERDVEYIRRAGVKIVTGRTIQSLQQLRDEGFEAIFLAVGTHKGVQLKIPGEKLSGVIDAMTFLRDVNVGDLDRMEGRVAVVGGGNAAIDSARTALRLGADKVTLLYRRRRQEMPALREEIEEALMEGIEMHFLVAPLAIEGDERISSVRCCQVKLGDADESGRRRPILVPDSEITFDVEHMIVAIGQGPELEFAAIDEALVVDGKWPVVHPVTQRSGGGDVFAGGDAVTGPSTIVEAIAAGQRAAQAIDVFLGGKGELPPDDGFASRSKPTEEEAASPRQPIRSLTKKARQGNFDEVLKGYTLRAACTEARRCLRCDLE